MNFNGEGSGGGGMDFNGYPVGGGAQLDTSDKFLAGDLTVDNPGYAFKNDPTAGLYRYGSDEVSIVQGGKRRLVTNSLGTSVIQTLSFRDESDLGWGAVVVDSDQMLLNSVSNTIKLGGQSNLTLDLSDSTVPTLVKNSNSQRLNVDMSTKVKGGQFSDPTGFSMSYIPTSDSLTFQENMQGVTFTPEDVKDGRHINVTLPLPCLEGTCAMTITTTDPSDQFRTVGYRMTVANDFKVTHVGLPDDFYYLTEGFFVAVYDTNGSLVVPPTDAGGVTEFSGIWRLIPVTPVYLTGGQDYYVVTVLDEAYLNNTVGVDVSDVVVPLSSVPVSSSTVGTFNDDFKFPDLLTSPIGPLGNLPIVAGNGSIPWISAKTRGLRNYVSNHIFSVDGDILAGRNLSGGFPSIYDPTYFSSLELNVPGADTLPILGETVLIPSGSEGYIITWDSKTGTATIPSAGWYRIGMQCVWDASFGTIGTIYCKTSQDGYTEARALQGAIGFGFVDVGPTPTNSSDMLYLTAGEGVRFYANSGGIGQNIISTPVYKTILTINQVWLDLSALS